jgi:lactate dehydrogenase-like 2-hydroxyacid dehydrogenase
LIEIKKILFSHYVPEECIEKYKFNFHITSPDKQKEQFSTEELKKMLPENDAFICMNDYKFTQEMIDCGTSLQAIGNSGAGYDNIDVHYATEKGIPVINAPTAVLEAAAELTIGLMLSITRGIVMYNKELKSTKQVKKYSFFDRDMMISGKTLGIIGFGKIGKTVAKKAQGLGMNIVYYDKYPAAPELEKALNVKYLPMEEVLKISDVVTLHTPYLKENYHLIGAEQFSIMKKTAYFINTSRGPIVNELELASALKEGIIRGAALDVFEFEPTVSDEIAELENVVIVPHVGTNVLECRMGIVKEAIYGTTEVLLGHRPYNIINPTVFGK